MQSFDNYPDVLISLFEANKYENIVDSNFLNAYIPYDCPVPRIEDLRQGGSNLREKRHPGYIKSPEINQVFNYIGFIKRIRSREYAQYLPMLFQELKRFIRVIEEVIYAPFISISEDIYVELDNGLQNFFDAYHSRTCHRGSWVEETWKYQKHFLDHIDMFLKTLKINGQVFDLKSDALHEAIAEFCKKYFHDKRENPPGDTDINFVANCCSKAAIDNEPKTIWSGDRHITRILKALHHHSNLTKEFPQIYLRANYHPLYFKQIFPEN